MTIQIGQQEQEQQQPLHRVRLLRLKRKRDESTDDALGALGREGCWHTRLGGIELSC